MKHKRVLLAVVSDLHVGSTVAICPPNGIALEDGGRYQPNVAQVWIWDQWLRYRDLLAGYRKAGMVKPITFPVPTRAAHVAKV